MKISVLIPTFNNLPYLKLCINSLVKYSFFNNHEIIVHVNDGSDGTLNFIKEKNIKYTHSNTNIGLCSAINKCATEASHNYLLYAHDDMFFLPKWDFYLSEVVNKINTKLFYLSSIQICPNDPSKDGEINDIKKNFGTDYKNFDEEGLIINHDKYTFYDLQGTHWAPHLIHKELWNQVGGYSEEFNPGYGSDPDFNMKLWQIGVRHFQGVNLSRVYHFGSLTTRKNKFIKANPGKKIFLKKWGITVEMFTRCYLRRGEKFDGPLINYPKKNLLYFKELVISKIKILKLFFTKT